MLNKDAALDILRPAFPKIAQAVFKGLEDFTQLSGLATANGTPFHPRSMPPVLQGWIVQRAQQIFDGSPGVRHEPGCKSQDLFHSGDYVFCFKKSSEGLVSNHPSGRQDRLRSSGQMTFEWGSKAKWVVIAYEVDPSWTSITDIQVVSPKWYSANFWEHSILDELRGIGGVPLPFAPAPPSAPAVVPSKTRVTRKRMRS